MGFCAFVAVDWLDHLVMIPLPSSAAAAVAVSFLLLCGTALGYPSYARCDFGSYMDDSIMNDNSPSTVTNLLATSEATFSAVGDIITVELTSLKSQGVSPALCLPLTNHHVIIMSMHDNIDLLP